MKLGFIDGLVIRGVLPKWTLIRGYSVYQQRLTEQDGDYPDSSNRNPHAKWNLAVNPPSLCRPDQLATTLEVWAIDGHIEPENIVDAQPSGSKYRGGTSFESTAAQPRPQGLTRPKSGCWMMLSVRRPPLDVIRSTEVRSVFNRALKPELKRLGFKTARDGPAGWAREVPPVRVFFWIQFSSYGFFRDVGGEFIVEFEFHNSARHTSIRDRMWRLLDDESRRNVVDLNNQAIKALPGPQPEIYGQLPGELDAVHSQRFELITKTPPLHSDVWFRYATRANVGAWAEFLASRFGSIIARNEDRLGTMPEESAIFLGTVKKRGEDKWTTLDE